MEQIYDNVLTLLSTPLFKKAIIILILIVIAACVIKFIASMVKWVVIVVLLVACFGGFKGVDWYEQYIHPTISSWGLQRAFDEIDVSSLKNGEFYKGVAKLGKTGWSVTIDQGKTWLPLGTFKVENSGDGYNFVTSNGDVYPVKEKDLLDLIERAKQLPDKPTFRIGDSE